MISDRAAQKDRDTGYPACLFWFGCGDGLHDHDGVISSKSERSSGILWSLKELLDIKSVRISRRMEAKVYEVLMDAKADGGEREGVEEYRTIGMELHLVCT